MPGFFSARVIASTSPCLTEWLIAFTGKLSMQISPTGPRTSNVTILDAAVCLFMFLSLSLAYDKMVSCSVY